MGEPKERRGDGPDLTSDEPGVPDIQGRGKALIVGGLVLLAAGFGAGYWLARTHSPTDATPSALPASPVSAPSVEIRVDPTKVRLANTSLELKSLPPPPEQNLAPKTQKP